MLPASSKITLLISLDLATGQVQLQGPLHDKIICYGMLERAKDLVREFDVKKQGLVVANGVLAA